MQTHKAHKTVCATPAVQRHGMEHHCEYPCCLNVPDLVHEEVPTKCSWDHLYAKHGLWNQTPRYTWMLSYLESVHGETCQVVEGLLTNHTLAAAQLDFLQVDKRITIMWLCNAKILLVHKHL